MMKRAIALISIAFLACAVFTVAAADNYPSKPLEIIAPANAGGGFDALARAIDRALNVEKLYPQPTAVANVPGGGGAIGFAKMQSKA